MKQRQLLPKTHIVMCVFWLEDYITMLHKQIMEQMYFMVCAEAGS